MEERPEVRSGSGDGEGSETWRPGLIGWLLVLLLFCLPMQFRTGAGPRIAPSDLFLGLALLGSLWQMRVLKSAWSIWHLGLLLMFTGGLAVAAAGPGGVGSYALVQKGFGLILLFLLYAVLTAYAGDWTRIQGLLRAFVLSVAVHNLIAMAAFFADFQAPWINSYSGRLSGMLIDPNAYGGLLVVTFAIHAATSFLRTPLVGGVLGLFTTLTMAMGIFLTFSRSSWIGMALVLAVMTVLRPRLVPKLFALLAVAAGAVLLVKGTEYIGIITEMATRENQIEVRLDLIRTGWEMFYESPLLGAGLGTFYETQGAIIHNTLFWILTEFGLVGISVFLGFILWFGWRGWVAYRLAGPKERPLLLGLLLAHVAMIGLSMGIEATYQRHWWVVLAMIAAAAESANGKRGRHGRT